MSKVEKCGHRGGIFKATVNVHKLYHYCDNLQLLDTAIPRNVSFSKMQNAKLLLTEPF